MKRDMDLIRQILLAIEDQHNGRFDCALESNSIAIDGFDPVAVAYHTALLVNEGFLTAYEHTHLGSMYSNYLIESITWKGHEFLDAARSPTVWQTAKSKIGDLSTVSIDVLKSVLATVATKMILGQAE